jgi:predicted nucleic acid-binding protein
MRVGYVNIYADLKRYFEETSPERKTPLPGVGAYRSGHRNISEKAEELLKQAARQGEWPCGRYWRIVCPLYDGDDVHHATVRQVVENERGPIIIPIIILAELDYLLREFLGVETELDFLEGIARGAYTLEPFTAEDLARVRELIATYRALDIGLADAAIAAAAERLRVSRILTVDERDFRAICPRRGHFTLLPANAKENG